MTRYITYILLLTSFASFGQIKHPKKKSKTPTVLLDGRHRKDLNEYFTMLDTNYLKYKLPDTFSKPAKWLENEKERNGEFRIDYFSPYPDSFKLLTALSYIDTAKEFDKVCKAKSWCIDNFKTCFPHLVARLSYKEKIGLTNTADLIIWDRMGTGDLAFYGHGGFVNEDLFTIAGRASWILNDLTGEQFASVHGRLTKEEAENYKTLWIKYIQTLKGQTLSDTINLLKEYSHNYLELLFNKRDIDSAMTFWDKNIAEELKRDYSNHKQKCDTDSTLKAFFTNDINTFCSRVRGNIEFFATDDKEGINIVYLPTPDEGYIFLIHYDFYGDFECHNLLMRAFLNFQSSDKGKTWTLVQDSWIQNYMILNYYKKDYYGIKQRN